MVLSIAIVRNLHQYASKTDLGHAVLLRRWSPTLSQKTRKSGARSVVLLNQGPLFFVLAVPVDFVRGDDDGGGYLVFSIQIQEANA